MNNFESFYATITFEDSEIRFSSMTIENIIHDIAAYCKGIWITCDSSKYNNEEELINDYFMNFKEKSIYLSPSIKESVSTQHMMEKMAKLRK